MASPDSNLPACTIVRSRRRTMALILYPDNRLEVRCGLKTSKAVIDQFIATKQAWIHQKMQENHQLIWLKSPVGLPLEHLRNHTRLQVETIMARHPALTPQKVVIRRQKRRWGSCSRQGSIAINLSAGQLPAELLEYIVVHELCHLVHLDHSPRFYAFLEQLLPDHRQRQMQLRRYVLT
jgi:hypothetical protein